MKTTTLQQRPLKRIAYGAAKVYGWKVFYLDCKGDADTASYRRKLMTATANILQQASDRHLFTTLADLHPLMIGNWVKIGSVAPTHEHVVGGAKTNYMIEETEHVLLR